MLFLGDFYRDQISGHLEPHKMNVNCGVAGTSAGRRHNEFTSDNAAYPLRAKYRTWSFTMLMGPCQMESRMAQMKIVSDYLLYYHNDKNVIGVVQFSRGVSRLELERVYGEFVFQKLTSDGMVTRIGWIHRNKTAHTEFGTFRRRQVIKPFLEDNQREFLYFYNPETGLVSKSNKHTGIAELARKSDKTENVVIESESVVIESDTEIDEPK